MYNSIYRLTDLQKYSKLFNKSLNLFYKIYAPYDILILQSLEKNLGNIISSNISKVLNLQITFIGIFTESDVFTNNIAPNCWQRLWLRWSIASYSMCSRSQWNDNRNPNIYDGVIIDAWLSHRADRCCGSFDSMHSKAFWINIRIENFRLFSNIS